MNFFFFTVIEGDWIFITINMTDKSCADGKYNESSLLNGFDKVVTTSMCRFTSTLVKLKITYFCVLLQAKFMYSFRVWRLLWLHHNIYKIAGNWLCSFSLFLWTERQLFPIPSWSLSKNYKLFNSTPYNVFLEGYLSRQS